MPWVDGKGLWIGRHETHGLVVFDKNADEEAAAASDHDPDDMIVFYVAENRIGKVKRSVMRRYTCGVGLSEHEIAEAHAAYAGYLELELQRSRQREEKREEEKRRLEQTRLETMRARLEAKRVAKLSLTERHQARLERLGLAFRGVRSASGGLDARRIAKCYVCKLRLDNTVDIECVACGWILCNCGACGCGYWSAPKTGHP